MVNKPKKLVDIEVDNSIVSGQQGSVAALSPRPRSDEGGIKICSDTWEEWCSIARYVYRMDPEAEVADVFEWIRLNDLGGQPYSEGLLQRVDREIATELGKWS